jgi:polysaccharide export outer membrane protein
MKQFQHIVFYCIASVFMFISCNNKSYVYFYENTKNGSDTIHYQPVKTTYLLQPNDVIYIEFHSTLTNAEEFFSFASQNTGGNMQVSPSTMYLNHYVVSDSGIIKIPVIGSVSVAGKTLDNIEKNLVVEGRKYVNDVIVKVKLLSYKITFLGEFGQPGEKYFYSDKVSLVDALAAAGEVSFYGDRKNIRIMRQTDKGIESFRINLTDAQLLNSPNFYLNPNDVVYAEPLPRKIFKMQSADYTTLLVTISSTIAILSLILTRN